MRWKHIGETSTLEGHKMYYSGRDDRHEQGVGFLIHKNAVNYIMNCNAVSDRLITIRLRSSPFNITIIQAYAPTSDYDDAEIEDFYERLQVVIDGIQKRTSLWYKGTGTPR